MGLQNSKSYFHAGFAHDEIRISIKENSILWYF